MTKAIFIDRDGTLLDEPKTEVINTWDKFQIKEGVSCLAELQKAGYKLFILSNQEGLNEGTLDKNFYDKTNKKLLFVLQNYSVKIEEIYTCPHAIAENCSCRKPRAGLIEQATQSFELDRNECWVIGDRISDVELAHVSGMKSVFIKSDLHKVGDAKPDFIAVNLCEAVKHIINNNLRSNY